MTGKKREGMLNRKRGEQCRRRVRGNNVDRGWWVEKGVRSEGRMTRK